MATAMTKEEYKQVAQIAERAVKLYCNAGEEREPIDIQMDLECCNETIPLDFNKLECINNFNLMHDISGIGRHLNRETRQIEDCFLPRCAIGD